MKNKSDQSRIDKICTTDFTQRRKTWFDRISAEDQQLCLDVRRQVVEKGLSANRVAANLIQELQLKCGRSVVREWLLKGGEQ